MSSYIISTDLNGTLLDHNTYSFHKAAQALECCCDQNIPIIFNTSKTFAQTVPITRQLDNSHPFVVENGAAIYVAKDYFSDETLVYLESVDLKLVDIGEFWVIVYGSKTIEIRKKLSDLSQQFKFEHEADVSAEDIAIIGHLPLSHARQIKLREFSELIVWQDSDEQLKQFKETLKQLQLTCMINGSLVYVFGQHDKAAPLRTLKQLYEKQNQQAPTLIALGDSENDAPMLNFADVAIIVDSPVHQNLILEDHANMIRAKFPGPIGWNDAILTLLGVCNEDLLAE